jgi:hypothetical protein
MPAKPSVRLLYVVFALSALALSAGAQNDPNRPNRAGRPDRAQRPERPGRADAQQAQSPQFMSAIKSALEAAGLNDDQKAKAADILKSASERLAQARQEMESAQGGDRRAAMQKMGEISRSLTEELAGILDEDQKAVFKQKFEQARQAVAQNFRDRAAGPGDPGAGGGPRGMPLDRALEQAATQLQLSDDQKQKVQALASDVATRTRALHEEALKQLKTILSEDQVKQFEQLAARPGLGGGPGVGAPGGGPGAIIERVREALEQLQLTDDQKAQIKPLVDEFRKNIEELRASIQNGAGPELREKLRGYMQELRSGLQKILTPEQLEKVRGALGQFGEGRRVGEPPRRDQQRRDQPPNGANRRPGPRQNQQ